MPGALDRLAKTATDLIQKYGSSAEIIQRVSGGRYDAARMKKKSQKTETIPIICTPPQRSTTPNEGNTQDFGFLSFMSPVETSPKLFETLVFKGQSYKVLKADPIYSGEIVAVYELQLEG